MSLFKKAGKLDCNNYRPISLLPNLSKVFKKLMHQRLTLFLENKKKFFKFQFGFRNIHSMTHVLISLTEQIFNALDNNKFACCVFIDRQNTFDTVNHKILLSKLDYGICGLRLSWF